MVPISFSVFGLKGKNEKYETKKISEFFNKISNKLRAKKN